MKTVSVRLEKDQAAKLEKLSAELRNSEVGVLRFALDLLHDTVATKASAPSLSRPARPMSKAS